MDKAELKERQRLLYEARRIYKHYNGELMPGYQIHHVDGNWRNNDPDNLIAVSRCEHWELHDAYKGRKARHKAYRLYGDEPVRELRF